VIALPGPSGGTDGRCAGQPRVAGVVVPVRSELQHLGVGPRTHGQALAPVRYGLVRRFAFVANERQVLDAHGTETEFLAGAAIGTNGVARQSGQFLHGLFRGRHGK